MEPDQTTPPTLPYATAHHSPRPWLIAAGVAALVISAGTFVARVMTAPSYVEILNEPIDYVAFWLRFTPPTLQCAVLVIGGIALLRGSRRAWNCAIVYVVIGMIEQIIATALFPFEAGQDSRTPAGNVAWLLYGFGTAAVRGLFLLFLLTLLYRPRVREQFDEWADAIKQNE